MKKAKRQAGRKEEMVGDESPAGYQPRIAMPATGTAHHSVWVATAGFPMEGLVLCIHLNKYFCFLNR